MRIGILIFILIALLLLPTNFILAKKSGPFLDHAANLIYQDCGKSDLLVKESSFLRFFPLFDENKILSVPQSWKVGSPTKQEVIFLLQWLDEKWIFPSYMLGRIQNGHYVTIQDGQTFGNKTLRSTNNAKEHTFMIDGKSLFSCGNKNFDIEGDRWTWGEKTIEIPKAFINIQELALMKIEVGGLTFSLWQFGFLTIPIVGWYMEKKKLRKKDL